LIASLWPCTPAFAYRTFEDDPSVRQDARWQSNEITLELSTIGTGEGLAWELGAAFEAAALTWQRVDCMSLSLERTSTNLPARARDGRSTVQIIRSGWSSLGFSPDRGAATDVRLTQSDEGQYAIVEADIYLNFEHHEFVFGHPRDNELDAQAVLTHELGHVLGLLHPCEEHADSVAPLCEPGSAALESALYPIYLGEQARMLSDDDRRGACALYARATPCAAGCAEGEVCSIDGCTPDPCLEDPATCGAHRCRLDTDCDTDSSCARSGPSPGYCISFGALGAACSRGDECASGLCVTSRAHGISYCTNACTDDSQCSGYQRCAVVDGRGVCAPVDESASCAVSQPSKDRTPGTIELSFLIFLTLVRLARRRRLRRGDFS
jgi:hypothetical protein